MEGYKTRVAYVSKDIDTAERIKFKDTSDAYKIDTAIGDSEALVLNVEYYGVLDIHNEKADSNPDYKNYVFVTDNGEKYVTGSESLWTAFVDIIDELKEDGIESIPPVKFYKKESKNYKGKYFLTCSLA